MSKAARELARWIFLLLIALPVSVLSQEDLDEGKTLFRTNCAQCHSRNMVDPLTGPPLGGAEANWEDFPREELYGWIRNSQQLISQGHPRAVELWNEWSPTLMNNFPNLTDQQIENILAYINGVYTGEIGGPAQAQEVVVGDEGSGSNVMLYVLAGILIVLMLVLGRVIANLNYLIKLKEAPEGAYVRRIRLIDVLTSKGVVGLVLFALILFGGYTTVNNAIALGRQQGYSPDQPIKFSHETHSGLHQIDCNYCHDGARRSKQSVIPAANTCMNCHRAIRKGTQYGTAEIGKIFASIGYNPATDSYIENYDGLTESEIMDIYTQWIADEYLRDNGLEELDAVGELLVDEQWNGIVTSLTNDEKEKIQGPIEWVRVHNLPDHVFFSHQQHTTIGQLECQECHGKVEEMELLYQYAPLSMGWCINCHRQTEVQAFRDNDYYLQSYQRYHDAIANGTKTMITVEDIGGLECQKCHY
jgi:mono/diheme cytochrome c family protein